MAIKTDTVTINGTQYKHTYSTTGHMITRNDNKQFVEAYDPTTSSYTYTESTLLALQSLGARLSALETSHNTLQQEHDALEALPHIIETGTSKDGLSWYKLYSDKCCMQGGYVSNSGHGAAYTNTVTFLKPYKDTNYTFLRNCHKNNIGNDPGTRWITGYNVKYTNRVTFFTDQQGYIAGDLWWAIGYTN